MRFLDVLLNYESDVGVFPAVLDILQYDVETTRKEYAFALAKRVWLHDIRDLFVLILLELVA